MAPLCAEFGISRKTGYKIFDRYKDCGVGAFTDRSRRLAKGGIRNPPLDKGLRVRSLSPSTIHFLSLSVRNSRGRRLCLCRRFDPVIVGRSPHMRKWQ